MTRYDVARAPGALIRQNTAAKCTCNYEVYFVWNGAQTSTGVIGVKTYFVKYYLKSYDKLPHFCIAPFINTVQEKVTNKILYCYASTTKSWQKLAGAKLTHFVSLHMGELCLVFQYISRALTLHFLTAQSYGKS